MSSILVVDEVTQKFGEFTALRDVSMAVSAGERLAIIGPNGAGKSTLFDVLSGRLSPTGGRIRLFGTDVTDWPPHRVARQRVGRSFQSSSFFPALTVLENVQISIMAATERSRRCLGLGASTYRDEAAEALDAVGVLPLAMTPAGELSHGDQRRLELAVTLAQQPKLLLLDEPTAGMAPAETIEAIELVRRLADERKLTLIFTEHDMEVVFSTAQRVLVMFQGQVIADGAPEHVRTIDRVREAYLGTDL